MNTYIKAGIGLAAVVSLLTGCSATTKDAEPAAATGDSAAAPAIEGLIKPGELSVCIDPEYAPLEYYENGSGGDIIGADADSAKALAEHLGLDLRFEVVSFDGLIPGITTGRCDLQLGGLYMSPERLQVTDATPFMQAGAAIIVNKKIEGDVAKAEDLCGLSVAAQSASSNSIKIHEISDQCKADGKPAVKITEYPQTAPTVLAVVNGKSDALIETNVGAAYIASQNKDTLTVAPGIFEPDTTFGAFTKKGNPLLDTVAKGLKELHDDGTLAEIMTKYELDPTIVDVY